MTGKEFFTTRTVGEALAGFRPTRRTTTQGVPLCHALHRVPAADITATAPLPGFTRSTVDGYAVRAADTYGASEGLPSYLDLTGTVRIGRAPDLTLPPGGCIAIPTGGVLPPGADAVVMVENTAETTPGTIEILRPVAPGNAIVRADEDIAPGGLLVPAGRPLRAPDLGLLAAAGITEVHVHTRPRVTIISTGDEVVPPATTELAPGQVRDATATALAALITDAGGNPIILGIVPDDPHALRSTLRRALPDADLVVISAGSSVGTRDDTASTIAELGDIWCHGLTIKPGKPTLLAQCPTPPTDTPPTAAPAATTPPPTPPPTPPRPTTPPTTHPTPAPVPVIGLPGNPLSALVVFRLLGVPLVWQLAGCDHPPPEPTTRARLSRDLPSAAGRLDIVQVTVRNGIAEPIFGPSALLSVLTRADGCITIPEPATGLHTNTHVDITLYR